MAKELQFFSDITGLTIEARVFFDDDIVATIELTEGDNLVYLGDMPTTLPMAEFAIGFFESGEMIGFGSIMWNGVQELNFGNIVTGGGGGIIDLTKKHEEIIEKYEKLMKNELKKIVESIPKIDISPVLTAISNIPVANLSDITLALSALRGQIKLFNATIKNDYISERNRIELEYKDKLDKKASLLQENEYNAKEKEKIILDLSSKITSLAKIVEELQEESKEKEEEMKQIEEHYINEIEEAKKEKEEEIIEKIIPILS